MAGIFTKTKQILELMDEAQSKISSLEEVFKEKNTSCEALQNTINAFKKSHSENNVFIETYEQMREIMKEKHRKILDLAQIIYTSCQDISKEINAGQLKCKTNVELLNKSQEKFKVQQRKFENENKKLDQQLEAISNSLEETESLKNKESEVCASLKRDLDTLEQENNAYEDSLNKKVFFLNEEEKGEENKGQKITEEFFMVDNEAKKHAEQLEDNKKRMYQQITEIQYILTGIEDELLSKNDILMKKKTEFETLAGRSEQIQNQIKSTDESITIIKCELNNYEKEAEYNNNNIKMNDENHKKDMTTLQKKICEQENILLQQEQFKTNISEEILSTTRENDVLSNDISEINNFITTTREALIGNLEEEIVSTELNLQNIKLALKEMKNERNKKNTEIDIKTKQHENDITELDLNIKKQQEAIAILENKSTQDEDNINRIIQMTENQNKLLSDLETEVSNVKNEIFDKEKQKLFTPKRNSNKKAKLEPLPNHSNWDSDSSIEGLDRTVYLKTLDKFRKQGAKKNFPK